MDIENCKPDKPDKRKPDKRMDIENCNEILHLNVVLVLKKTHCNKIYGKFTVCYFKLQLK